MCSTFAASQSKTIEDHLYLQCTYEWPVRQRAPELCPAQPNWRLPACRANDLPSVGPDGQTGRRTTVSERFAPIRGNALLKFSAWKRSRKLPSASTRSDSVEKRRPRDKTRHRSI